MKVLLVGGGGREHALGWKLVRSERVSRLISLPGNPGLAQLGAVVDDVDPMATVAVAEVAVREGVDLVVVGPEAPLAAGLVDELVRSKIPTWGPNRAAARLESSKTFAKQVMDQAEVPTADWAGFTDPAPALSYLDALPGPYVVKADGLAAGKGVLVSTDRAEAKAWVMKCLEGGFGTAGTTIVIEDHLAGPEVSVFAMCAGTDVIPLEPARDYKRLGDGDQGPNTGGMGAFSPVTDLPVDLVSDVVGTVFRPVLSHMAAQGSPYTGFLYAGLVLTGSGPKVLEFNCRLGDPETQVVLPRLETDLVDLIEAGLDGDLSSVAVGWSDRVTVNVVVAAAGYPDDPRRGDLIELPAVAENQILFHAGTSIMNGALVTAGGRVLNAVGLGPSLSDARESAYELADAIGFPGKQYRRDIAETR
ncbi:MAG TPA: phosphoribosylamine--glycine ligase [Acidimicrobiia bacterium]